MQAAQSRGPHPKSPPTWTCSPCGTPHCPQTLLLPHRAATFGALCPAGSFEPAEASAWRHLCCPRTNPTLLQLRQGRRNGPCGLRTGCTPRLNNGRCAGHGGERSPRRAERRGRGLRRVGCACRADLEPRELPLPKAPATAAVPARAHGAAAVPRDLPPSPGTCHCPHQMCRLPHRWFPAIGVGWRRLSLSLGDSRERLRGVRAENTVGQYYKVVCFVKWHHVQTAACGDCDKDTLGAAQGDRARLISPRWLCRLEGGQESPRP